MTNLLEKELAVLSSKQGLIYLTTNDWALVVDKARRVKVKKGAILVSRGQEPDGVFLLLKGAANVQIPSQRESRSLGPGEVYGEMSFLEDVPASASVVAASDVEAYHLDRATLQSMFELYPHLASRFYRSLARNLSRRLRAQIASKPVAEG